MQPKTFLLIASAALIANAQITRVGRPATTATQAVFSYHAPDSNPCTVEVRQKGDTALVHDVNPALFAGADTDLSRPSTVVLGQRRVFVAGKRTAEKAADNRMYSRALQAATEHVFTIRCGSADPYTGSFQTTNIPLGNSYMEPIPADPAAPGETAWPTLEWGNRAQKLIDPQTGVLLQRISTEKDVVVRYTLPFQGAVGDGWTNAAAVLVEDGNAATYSGATRDPLFLEHGQYSFFGGTHNAQVGRYNEIQVELNAWCGGGDCTTASEDDRSIEVCLTIDRVSCVSPVQTRILEPCTLSCNGPSPHRFFFGDTLTNQPGYFEGWFPGSAEPPFDYTSIYKRNSGVNREGDKVTWVYGDQFDANWKAGTKIIINNVEYAIASLQSTKELTLAGSPSGVEFYAVSQASNFGALVRKKTTSTTPVSVQFAQLRVIYSDGAAYWDASGGIESATNCSLQLVAGPGGEMGWHCHISQRLYWIGKDTGKVSMLGQAIIPFRGGADGWPYFYCGAAFFDKNHADDLYCSVVDAAGDAAVVQAHYRGDNRDLGQIGLYDAVTECGFNPEPCWELTNLTPKSQNLSLRQQVAAFNPDFAAFPNTGFRLLSNAGSSSRFLFVAYQDYTANDIPGFYAYYNVETRAVEGAMPTWKYWPLRWAALHGSADIGDSSWTFIPMTYYRGPFSGGDYLAGNGPYASRITAPIGLTGAPCPSRPPGSPIPDAEWPTGNVCATITVDGEPGDPSPKISSSGAVTVTGDQIALTGGSFPVEGNGMKMRINGEYYVFTRTSGTSGTLSPQPVVAISNSAYELFLEPVDNPKTGTARRDNAYLQDAEVRDTFCVTTTPVYQASGCGQFYQNEYFRILIKDGNTWTVERGYSKNPDRQPFFSQPANAYAIFVPPTCDFKVYPCSKASAFWSPDLDPLGRNQNNTTLQDFGSDGSGHQITRPVGEVSAVALLGCPAIDGLGYSCYNARVGNNIVDTLTSTRNLVFNGQPPFHGKLGWGTPNVVDSHPSLPGLLHPMHRQPGGAPRWFLDGRTFQGGGSVSGNSGSPAVPVEGDLMKFSPAQFQRMRRKVLPTMAACGSRPLVDVSAVSSLITSSPADRYKYCVAEQAGECQPSSQPGEVYFNCPLVAERYCKTAGIGSQESDTSDVCIGDVAAFTNSAIQMGFEKVNMQGLYGRPITKQLTRYRYVDVFWNVKSTPDGQWMLFRTPWANGFGHETLMAKLPPFPAKDNINRGDFIPVPVRIPAPGNTEETRAMLEFGYTPDFHCTSRQEACVKASETSEFSWAHENPAGVACSAGCTITIPALSQRILYYRIVRQKEGNVRGSVGRTEVQATP